MKRTLAKRLSLIALTGIGLAGVALGVGLSMRADPDLSVLPDMVQVAGTGAAPLYVQISEVTVADWNRCADAGACALRLRAPRGDIATAYPATGISFVDAQQYIGWINAASGQDFRLPTAREWRLMAEEVMPEVPDPIFTDPALTWASAYLTETQISRRLSPTGSFATTSTGVRDLDGNVWEWTQDCHAGSAGGGDPDRCPAFVVQGLHEAVMSYLVRDPARGGCAVGAPPAHLGIRLVSDKPLPRKI